jgi:hypothetical protein
LVVATEKPVTQRGSSDQPVLEVAIVGGRADVQAGTTLAARKGLSLGLAP